MKLEILSEQKERQLLHYFCLISNNHRYDLTIGYSEHFFGKAMVTSIQTGNMVLLCREDTYAEELWADRLGIEHEDIPEFQEFFGLVLQTAPYQEQY
ncbi:SAV0927 family protein [Neobacillus bataviensis]|uniref:SAV0927 family protein n=1 Tax=Neobacillus bataviensis TaxID=220685 RepID=UPI001CBF6008|nr:SAV0927 family protein [Neobacillus bataviensis]